MRSVLVVGGGLAGLTVAKQLEPKGLHVEILEADVHAGGKAGADEVRGYMREHGYHIFPAWYVNVRPIVDELGVTLIDFDRWHYLKPGDVDHPITVKVPHTLTGALASLRGGLAPWQDQFLYWYFVLDMLGVPLHRKDFLDHVSRVGMMHDRWYVTEGVAQIERENILKASAVPAFEMSAMTAKLISAYWVKAPSPFVSVLPNDLQTAFIDPYVNLVTSQGSTLHLRTQVVSIDVNGGRIASVTTADGKKHVADDYVITTPVDVTRRLVGADLQRLDPDLGRFEHLQSAPMASLHITLDKTLHDLPREHTFLYGGRYGLSFIDVTNLWPGQTTTTLSFISSNFSLVQDLPEADQVDLLFEEIAKYLPIARGDVKDMHLESNVDDPLFINTVGAWDDRPDVHSQEVPNLYFAGDWVRNPVDLASMEGAVTSAMTCARAIAREAGVTLPDPPKKAATWPAWLLRTLKWALTPAAVGAWVYAELTGASR